MYVSELRGIHRLFPSCTLFALIHSLIVSENHNTMVRRPNIAHLWHPSGGKNIFKIIFWFFFPKLYSDEIAFMDDLLKCWQCPAALHNQV